MRTQKKITQTTATITLTRMVRKRDPTNRAARKIQMKKMEAEMMMDRIKTLTKTQMETLMQVEKRKKRMAK